MYKLKEYEFYDRKNKRIINCKQFFLMFEHVITLTSEDKELLLDKLKMLAHAFRMNLVLKGKLDLDDFTKGIVFLNSKTREMFFKPLDDIDIEIYFEFYNFQILFYEIR